MPDDLAIIYRTTGAWGPGKLSRLTKVEVDENMWAFAQAIVALQSDRPEPPTIASITVAGRFMTILTTSGASFGPLPLPITEFRFRDEWQPFTIYDALDWFTVSGVGIFSTIYGHTSGAEFDPNIEVESLPALKKLFGPDAGSVTNSTVYDVEVLYQGRLSDIADPLIFLIALRSLIVPSAAIHAAYIIEAPASVPQVLPILHGSGEIGRVIFSVGQNTGSVVIDNDESIPIGERLAIGPPASTDSVAEGMTVAFALQRIVAA